MADNVDMNTFIRTNSTSESLQVCCGCGNILMMCLCSDTGQAATSRPTATLAHPRVYRDIDIFDVGFLDIESEPMQPDIDLGPLGYAATTPGSDLDVVAPMCEKSDHHSSFIDVDRFTIDDLPLEIRHCSVYVWLRNCSPLVVRLLRSIKATGRACLISQEWGQKVICKKTDCPYSTILGPNHMLHGGLGIITNKHVVESNEHAAMTTIEFFYNNDETHHSMVLKEYGTTLHITNTKMDYTLFSCFVHNKDLITMVATFDKRRNYSWLGIPKGIRETARNFAIVISHPHGTSKKISIGTVVNRRTYATSEQEIEIGQILRNIYNLCDSSRPYGLLRFEAYWRVIADVKLPVSITSYSTPTCKGSSGAPVYMGNTVLEYGEEINQAHTHRGVNSAGGSNICFT